jgi:hypothetical protein
VILYRDRDAGQEPGGLASIDLGGPREGRLGSDDREGVELGDPRERGGDDIGRGKLAGADPGRGRSR